MRSIESYHISGKSETMRTISITLSTRLISFDDSYAV